MSLHDLFDGRRQLIVYRAFYGPDVTTTARGTSYPERACLGCSMVADQVSHPAHLNARDTSLAFVSRAPQAEIQGLKERHGWELIPWYTITDDFDADFGVGEWHGHNVFIREGDQIFRTYFIDARGDEAMGSTWNYLDVTALGRQEEWEDSPEGYPQTPTGGMAGVPRRVRRGRLTRAGGLARGGVLDDRREALADADAERGDPVAEALALELADERSGEAGARAAERVSERDRAAVHVQALGVDAELALARQDLGGERLVDLDPVDVVEVELRGLERLADRRDRADAHHRGVDAGDADGDDAGERLGAQLLGAAARSP